MSQVNSSAEVIRQMKSDMNKTISELDMIVEKLRNIHGASSGWNDAQGEQFRGLMHKIAQCVNHPKHSLESALPKLEKLAQSLDQYGGIRF